MHYWIDGYNFFFRITKNYHSMKKQERALLEKLYQTMLYLKSPMTVVFDGRATDPPEALRRNLKALNIIYTPARQTADDYILERLDHCQNLAQEMVVSSDRELLRRAQHKGSYTQTVEQFLKMLLKKKERPLEEKKQTCESSYEFHRLLKIFENR